MLNQKYSRRIRLVVFSAAIHVTSIVMFHAQDKWNKGIRDNKLIYKVFADFVTNVQQAIVLSKRKEITFG